MTPIGRLAKSIRSINALEIAWCLLWLATVSHGMRTSEESLAGELDPTNLQRLGYLSAAGFILGLTLLNRVPRLRWNPVSIFLLYAVYSMTTFVWSASPIATLGKSGEIMVGCMIIWKTMSSPDSANRLKRLLNMYLLIFGIGFSLTIVNHIFSASELSRQESNGVSYSSALLGLILFARILSYRDSHFRRPRWILLYFILGFFCMYGNGRTANGIFFSGSIILLFRFKPWVTLFIIIPVGILMFVQFQDEIITFVLRGQSQAQFDAISGRQLLWELALKQIAEKPIFGAGFGVGARVVFFNFGTEGYDDDISNIHNAYLEAMLGSGLLGFTLLMVTFLWGFWMAVKNYFWATNMDVVVVFYYLTVISFVGSSFGGWFNGDLALFLFSIAFMYNFEKWKFDPDFYNSQKFLREDRNKRLT